MKKLLSNTHTHIREWEIQFMTGEQQRLHLYPIVPMPCIAKRNQLPAYREYTQDISWKMMSIAFKISYP